MRDADLIWHTGVVRRGAGRVWLEFSDVASCNRCSRGTGCGAALFSRLFVRPEACIPLDRDLYGNHGRPDGRLVRAGLDPRWLMLAAAATYLLPVAAFIAGTLIAELQWPRNDLAALVGGGLFLLATGFGVRHLLRRIGRPVLKLVDLDATLESGDVRGHLTVQD